MRSKSDVDEIVVLEVIVEGQALIKVFAGVRGPGGGYIHDGENELCPEAGCAQPLRTHVWKKVHVAARGDATEEHFGRGQVGAVTDKFARDPPAFERPNFVIEPSRQRHVVRIATKQRHRGVPMSVHKARHEDMTWELHMLQLLELSGVSAGH